MRFGELRPQEWTEGAALLQGQGDGEPTAGPDFVLALSVREQTGSPILGVIFVHRDPQGGYRNVMGIHPDHRDSDLPRQLASKALGKLYSRGIHCCHLQPDQTTGEGFWDSLRWQSTTPAANKQAV